MDLNDILLELGHDPFEIRLKAPDGYELPLEKMKELIDEYVSKYNHFPSQEQLRKDLGISSQQYSRYGSLKDFRRKLGYSDENHLVDKSGFINSSKYGMIVANYLIAQGLSYTREEYPFKHFDESHNYRSDFTFHLEDEHIHVEVWGELKHMRIKIKYLIMVKLSLASH